MAFIKASGYDIKVDNIASLDGITFSGSNPYHLIDANRHGDVVMNTSYKVTKRHYVESLVPRTQHDGDV